MSAEIKTGLKEARQLFKQNDYANVVKKCKAILKKEKDNYMALVLLAAAMQEIEEFKSQAPLALQKAVKVQPDNPLAWQGLVAYYEKEIEQDPDWSELAKAYCKLLQLDRASEKFLQMVTKVSELSLRVKDEETLNQTIQTLSDLRKSDDEQRAKFIDKMLAWILTSRTDSEKKYPDLFQDVLASVVQQEEVADRQDYYRKYLKALYNNGKSVVLIQEATKMHKLYSSDTCPLEYMCKVYYEQYIRGDIKRPVDIDISLVYETLLKMNAESQTALIAKAMHLKNTENFIKAREVMNQVIAINPLSLHAWIILNELSVKLNCWEDVENSAKQILKLAKDNKDEEFLHEIELKMLDAMSRSHSKQKLEQAAQLCDTLYRSRPSVQLQLIRVRIGVALREPDVYEKLDDLEMREESKIEACILRAIDLKHERRYEEAAIILDPALETPEAWLLLGKICLEMSEYNRSFMAFLHGVKLDRFNWECLVYLGRHYREHGNDVERSRRCYQTALLINPNSEQAGVGLSTAFRLLKNQTANIQLLQKLTMQDSGPKWAWLQLGLQHLDQGDATQAIKAFQHVIRADPNDNHSWESLADAYLARGAHNSALKSYQRALELSPESFYPRIQLGNIKLIVGQHYEAKEDFECILENHPRDVLALKGLAETCLSIAKEDMAGQLLGRARDHLQQAMDRITSALLQRNDLSCIWKLLGDICYKSATLPDAYCRLSVVPQLMKSDSIEEKILITRKDILLLCTKSYCLALSRSQDSPLLWHDLACCYYTRMKFDHTSDPKRLANGCIAAAKRSVELCPGSWVHWNFLGVVYMSPYIKNYALAQHCFVMAIDRELNNAVVWSNLGTLYLRIGKLRKANEAYSQAQRSDPAYMNSWVGQGLIAETVCKKEAMDLFRHSTQLGYHDQSAISYAHHVLTALLNQEAKKDSLYAYMIENMYAASVATDVLNWFIERNPSDAHGRNTYGLFLERQSRYRSAAEQFSAALKVADDEQKDNVCVNYARVLIQLKRYREAIDACRTVKKASFNSQCHLALALFKAEEYEESYGAYETALQWLAGSGLEKGSTLCAMASMAYIFQGVEDAKTLLFQCIQIQPPTVPGFLAAAALGILHGDLNLTTLVLKELKPFRDHYEYGHHVASLSAYLHLIKNDVTNALAVLSKAIHNHPHDARYWMRLLRILSETDLNTFERSAEKALFLSKGTINRNTVRVACVSLFSRLARNSETENLRAAQKIVFNYPADSESWAIFVAAASRCTDRDYKPNVSWLTKLRFIVEEKFQVTKPMAQWLSNNQKKVEALSRSTTVC